jgi:hypothetical protein
MGANFGVRSDNVSSGDRSGKKQRFIRGLALLMVLGMLVLTGCSSGDDNDSSDDGGSTSSGDKSGVYEQDGDTVAEDGETYEATGEDESSVYVYGGGTYTLTNGTLTKTGDNSSEELSNFEGYNAIVLAEGASTINLTKCTLTADSEGSNGVFAYESGSVVNVSNCTISTTGGSSRGVDATYGGTINISDSEITTTGAHSSVLATDRYDTASGEPEVNAYRVTGEASGDGSAGLYSTGTFYVEECALTANATGAAVIEGSNSITCVDTYLTVTLSGKYGVMVYQSGSGDALGNTGVFSMEGGSLSVNGGPYLLNTNDEAYFTLEGVTLSGSGIILKTGKYDWGDTASNGGITHLTTIGQTMAGDFIVDKYGNITAELTDGSSLVGAIDPDDSDNDNDSGDTEGGYVSLTLDSTSSWTADEDSYVDVLNGAIISGSDANVDAKADVTIYCKSGTDENGDALANGTYTLGLTGYLQVG